MRVMLFRLSLSLLTGLLLGAAAPAQGAALPAQASVGAVQHEYQRLNNCGPVTVGMALNRWGSTLTQYDIAPKLKSGAGDVNVSPDELAAFARARGFRAHLGTAGSRTLLRTLLAAGVPVIVETWFITPDSGGMGHYRLLTGYDDRAGHFTALDSYLGRLTVPYAKLEGWWRSFGGTYVVVYPPAREAQVRSALGWRAEPGREKAWALEQALADVRVRPDPLAWLNLGHATLAVGDARGAARAFDRAERAAPMRALDPTRPDRAAGGWAWRTLWYSFGPLEAYTRTGRYADVLRLTGAVLRDVPAHEEALYWRGRALAGLGRAEAARAAYREALRLRPGFEAARQALTRLG